MLTGKDIPPEDLEEIVTANTPKDNQQTPDVKFSTPARPMQSNKNQSSHTAYAAPKTRVKILSLDEYVTDFSKRYESERTFQQKVHKYMTLTKMNKIGLRMQRTFRRSKYNESIDHLIRSYAIKVRDNLLEAGSIKYDMELLDRAEQSLNEKKTDYTAHVTEQKNTEQTVQDLAKTYNSELTQAQDAVEQEKREAAAEFERKKQELIDQTNTAQVVKDTIKKHILNSKIMSVNASGTLEFDERAMMRRMEDMFLQEIITSIDKSDGGGFYNSTKRAYDEVISSWDELEDLSELPNVDWIQSIILSRTKGYRTAQFPYLIAGKFEELTKQGKASVNSATSVDTSGSMDDKSSPNAPTKLDLAKKTVLAQHALMRKLNPANLSYLSHFSDDLNEVDSITFFRNVNAKGFTRTDLAVKWLYESLADKGPGLAYLITDGDPQGCTVEDVIEQSKRFREAPYLKLRIFLIDGNRNTRDIIKRIGSAAGSDTKVIPVNSENLGTGVIRDISQAIQGMYGMDKF